MWNIQKKIWYILYSVTAKKLPKSSYSKVSMIFRYFFAKKILNKTGKNVNIEKNACFNPKVSIDDNSGIGISCELYGKVTIGKNVLMGPECVFYTCNHNYCDRNRNIIDQGVSEEKEIIVEDDVWIGRRAIVLPGVKIKKGCVVGAGAVVTKSFPEYSIIGGCPAKIIGKR